MTLAFPGIRAFLCVLVRLAGMVGFNPLLSRRNVPFRVRAGLVVFVAVLLSGFVPAQALVGLDSWELAMVYVKELALGAVLGYIFQIFYYMFFFVGDILDTMFGLAMAKTFDPGTNIQISVTGNLLTILFICYFFVTDNHLAMFHLFFRSFELLPVGAVQLGVSLASAMIQLFTQVFLLIIRIALPFAVVQFTLEVSMGILMKVIPQIHVFVINFQLKLGMGLAMLFLFAPYVSNFVDNYVVIMMDQLQAALVAMGAVL